METIGKIINPNEYTLYDNYVEIKVYSKAHGDRIVKIDLEDVEKCKQYQWNVVKCWNKKTNKEPNYYISGDRGKILLHRFIMNCPKGKVVDHINHDTMDNRKEMLRICSQGYNQANRNIFRTNKSGVTGVIWYPYNNVNKWMVNICIEGKGKTVGYYSNFDEAVQARQDAEKVYFGEFTFKDTKII